MIRYSTEFREEVLSELARGSTLTEVGRRYTLLPSTICNWRRRYKRRNRQHLGDDDRKLTREDLAFPPAEVEARACLKIAKRNGGIEAMRKTIEIDPLSMAFLDFWLEAGLLPAPTILRAKEYRGQVLEEFDKLVAREERRRRRSIAPAPIVSDDAGLGGT